MPRIPENILYTYSARTLHVLYTSSAPYGSLTRVGDWRERLEAQDTGDSNRVFFLKLTHRARGATCDERVAPTVAAGELPVLVVRARDQQVPHLRHGGVRSTPLVCIRSTWGLNRDVHVLDTGQLLAGEKKKKLEPS